MKINSKILRYEKYRNVLAEHLLDTLRKKKNITNYQNSKIKLLEINIYISFVLLNRLIKN